MLKTFAVTVEVDDSKVPLQEDSIAEGIATLITEFYGTDSTELHGWNETSATVDTVWVDGRRYDKDSSVLSDKVDFNR